MGAAGKATGVAFSAGSPVVHVELFDAYPPPVITLRVLGVATRIVEDFQIRAGLLMGEEADAEEWMVAEAGCGIYQDNRPESIIEPIFFAPSVIADFRRLRTKQSAEICVICG